jgi:hypothetical protein
MARSDTIAVTVGESTVAYKLNGLSQLEVSSGTASHWLAGAAIGFLVGGTAAFLFLNGGGSTSLCDQSANQDAIRLQECIGVAALVGGVPGAGLGALIGALVRTERWHDVALDRLRVGLTPQRLSGLRLSITVKL